jgi:hypothetical protein
MATGCVTKSPPGAIAIKNVNMSLGEVKNFIHHALPIGIRTISDNGREFYSQHFLVDKNEYVPAKDADIRYTARVLILNSSRPFEIEVEVRREVRRDRNGRIIYADEGYDLRLARILKDQIKDALAKRRDDLNLIDDFRVF